MEFKDNIPIYLQIEQYLYRQIALGKLTAGEKIPSVRKLALELTVNVNTVQRALQQMNSQGINNELEQFVQNMEEFGIGKNELVSTLENYLKNGGDQNE